MIKPASAYHLNDLAKLFTDAFDGYIGGSFSFDADSLANFIVRDGVNLAQSYVLTVDEQLAGFGLFSLRGDEARLATMGITKAFQGQGHGGHLLQEALKRQREQGIKSIWLECIAQNQAGMKLYPSLGFKTTEELYGFRGQVHDASSYPLEDISTHELAAAIAHYGDPDLPWQLSGFTLIHAPNTMRAVRHGPAMALLSPAINDAVHLRALIVLPEARRQGHAKRLLQGIQALYLNATLNIPILCPARYGGFFTALGLEKTALHQVQMKRLL